MPPLKKRRGLAGTIISTAVNAALIGSAVGLTVYRLWRNRGKPPQPPVEVPTEPSLEDLSPPPPYDAPSHHKQAFNFPEPEPVHAIPLSPPSSAKKLRNAQLQRQNKRTTTQHRRRKSQRTHPDHHHHHHHHSVSSSDPVLGDDVNEGEDKMDWIGDKLSMLIEQGKRALNAQVVVFSDAVEDEVDDGSDAWEEENDMQNNNSNLTSSPRHSRSRSGSVRYRKRPRTLNLGAGQSPSTFTSTSTTMNTPYAASSSTPSPRFADSFNLPASVSASVPNTSFIAGGGGLSSRYAALPASQSVTSLNNVSVEDPSTFDSPELRESMERARQRLMARRLGGA